jgi:hypothetical protein
MVATAPVLPVGYVVSASRIADRRMILTGSVGGLHDSVTHKFELALGQTHRHVHG